MLSIDKNCIFDGNGIIIPETLEADILEMLHEHDAHVGACRMKTAARQYVWWINIDKDIEAFARQCSECQAMQTSPSKTILSK